MERKCIIRDCPASTLERTYYTSLFPRRWMLRYCSKEHFNLAKKMAWDRVFHFTINFITVSLQFTFWLFRILFWLLWKIFYVLGIVLVVILYVFAAIAFWSMVFDVIDDILNPHKKANC